MPFRRTKTHERAWRAYRRTPLSVERADTDKKCKQRLAALEVIRNSLSKSKKAYNSRLSMLLGRTSSNTTNVDLYYTVGEPPSLSPCTASVR